MTIAGTFWFIRAIAALLLLGCLLPEPVVAGGEWVDLGTLGGEYSYCTGLSGDGGIIVGLSESSTNSSGHGFLWTKSEGMVDLGTLPGGSQSYASAVSADGLVVAGYSVSPEWNQVPFRWTREGGMVDLGASVGGRYFSPFALSADGKVIVGICATGEKVNDDNILHAIRLTEAEGIDDLGVLTGDFDSCAYAVSADGSVVVGISFVPYSITGWTNGHAFLWTKADGMVDLGKLGRGPYACATGVSADGKIVVGDAMDIHGKFRAFRWTIETGMIDLGATTDEIINPSATAISADGKVIVGHGTSTDPNSDGKARAFRWSRETGMQTLNHWLASNGVNATNIVFSTAIGVSADGNAVIGTLENVHGFLARVETGRSSYEPWMLLLSDE